MLERFLRDSSNFIGRFLSDRIELSNTSDRIAPDLTNAINLIAIQSADYPTRRGSHQENEKENE